VVVEMIRVTIKDFSVDEVVESIKADVMGALVTFIGIVRSSSGGRDVDHIEIQVYEEMARRQLELIREEALERFDVDKVAIVHRFGYLRVSEKIMMIVVGAAHRAEAFETCRYVLEAIKERVPIWKKEVTPEGDFWIEGEKYERA
jgi:molybdopterin synthase catalytic subunit